MRIEYCYNVEAKDANKKAQQRFVLNTANLLGTDWDVESKFNAGGIAVYGEHFVKFFLNGLPVVEAIITKGYTLVRQWNGKDSGANHYLHETRLRSAHDMEQMVRNLAARPFKRF